MTNTRELYQQVILDHNKNPRNFKELTPHTHDAEGYNPLCGDHIWVYLNVDENNIVQGITFKGNGCAISKASASLMTEHLKGKSVKECEMIIEEFRKLVTGELDPEKEEHHLGKLRIFSGIWEYPARVKCAILSWHTVVNALKGEGVANTEDEKNNKI